MLAPSTSRLVELQALLVADADAIESHPLPGEMPGSFERFVLAHGRSYSSAKLTTTERTVVDAAVARHRIVHGRFAPRECFTNSQNLLLCDESDQLVYVEGFAWTHALRHVLHGWLAIDGKVIDVTLPPITRREAELREPRQVVGEFENRTYLGVPLLRSYVEERIRIAGLGSLLDDPKHEYPLLQDGAVKALNGPGEPQA